MLFGGTPLNRYSNSFQPLSREFLLSRGYCCNSGCKNCPYPKETEKSEPACPVCGSHLIEIRTKMVCSKCHTICETCCDGGRIG
ncbi:MAG: DUF5522 domain-containing protein [Planctomycetota bacterium]